MKHTIILCAALLLCAALFSCGRPETVMPAEKPSAGVTAPSAGSSEPGKLAFSAQIIRTDGYRDGVDYPVVTVIDTADDLARYVADNKDLYDFSHKETVYSDTTIGLVDAIGKYDAAWFADHRLLVVLLEEGSGSIRHEVTAVTDGPDPAVDITLLCPECCTDDMAEWHILIELDREADLSGEITVRFTAQDV